MVSISRKNIETSLENIKELPIPIKNKLIDISIILNKLNDQELDKISSMDVEKLKNKIPQAINEFFLVPSECIKKVNGENEPEKILLDSLDKIEMKLNGIISLQYDSSIRQMKITNNYLKQKS